MYLKRLELQGFKSFADKTLLEFRPGITSVIGPNGSGKTSLIRHIFKFLNIQKGSIYLEKKDINSISRKVMASKISFVPQNVNVEVDFTAYDMVLMGRTPYLKRFQDISKEDEEKIYHAMKITNTLDLKDKSFSYLSGGEAQRVLIARAIAQDTKYLVLDEPISHLDIRYQVEVMETLKKLNKEENKTIIAILHDLNLSAAYCDKILLMKDGKVFAEGKSADVLTKDNLKKVYDMDFSIHYIDNRMFFVPVI
mgnify:CR=1 FL=1